MRKSNNELIPKRKEAEKFNLERERKHAKVAFNTESSGEGDAFHHGSSHVALRVPKPWDKIEIVEGRKIAFWC